jgi:membrane peptidoglycan carboxypeptidase
LHEAFYWRNNGRFSRYYAQPSGAFNVTTGFRQPGSSISQLLCIALENGITAATIIDDVQQRLESQEVHRTCLLIMMDDFMEEYHFDMHCKFIQYPCRQITSKLGGRRNGALCKEVGNNYLNDSSRFGLSLTRVGVRSYDLWQPFWWIGTTDMKKDNWTIGYTPDFVIESVWVGNNDNTPMNQYLASGITGAAPIWNRMMSYLLQNMEHTGMKTQKCR